MKKGFYKKNLIELMMLCDELIKVKNKHTILFFILKSIFSEIMISIEGISVDVKLFNNRTEKIKNNIVNLIENLDNLTVTQEYILLENLINDYYLNK